MVTTNEHKCELLLSEPVVAKVPVDPDTVSHMLLVLIKPSAGLLTVDSHTHVRLSTGVK